MTFRRMVIFLLTAFFTVSIFSIDSAGISPAFSATCPPMPKVGWWKKSHASMEKYVKRKYKNNWNSYIKKWIRYKSKLQGIHELESFIYLKAQDKRLAGDDLKIYIEDVEERIAVTKCLAKNYKDNKSEKEEFAVTQAPAFQCRPIPEVSWWGDLNHDGIKILVKRKFGNDWKRYIAFWDEEMIALMASFNLGQEATVNKLGLALSNEELGLYVSKVAGMLAVLHCLADDARAK